MGYQVTLDVGYFFPQLFDEAAHVFCGPGALAVLRQIFVNAPWPSTEKRRGEGGMEKGDEWDEQRKKGEKRRRDGEER